MRTMMSFSPSPTSVFLAALVSLAGASCSSAAAAPPSVFIDSTLGGSTDPTVTTNCSAAAPDTPYIMVGSSGTPTPNGGTSNGFAVTVSCEVSSASTDTYNVTVNTTDGANGGIQFSGLVTSGSGAMSTGIIASFSKPNGGSYVQKDCSITLSTEFTPAITSGRIAGTLSCPMVADESEGDDVCVGTATFIVENCQE